MAQKSRHQGRHSVTCWYALSSWLVEMGLSLQETRPPVTFAQEWTNTCYSCTYVTSVGPSYRDEWQGDGYLLS